MPALDFGCDWFAVRETSLVTLFARKVQAAETFLGVLGHKFSITRVNWEFPKLLFQFALNTHNCWKNTPFRTSGQYSFHEPTAPHMTQPRWGCGSLAAEPQGSLASSATLGFEAESLWDSQFELHGRN